MASQEQLTLRLVAVMTMSMVIARLGRMRIGEGRGEQGAKGGRAIERWK